MVKIKRLRKLSLIEQKGFENLVEQTNLRTEVMNERIRLCVEQIWNQMGDILPLSLHIKIHSFIDLQYTRSDVTVFVYFKMLFRSFICDYYVCLCTLPLVIKLP